jgi:hypothetical protein
MISNEARPMSLKYAVEKTSANILPRVGQMKVEAHACFSETLYERSEESMWTQLSAAASYDGMIDAYFMPDAHVGYGVPVGCVVMARSRSERTPEILPRAPVRGRPGARIWSRQPRKRPCSGLCSLVNPGIRHEANASGFLLAGDAVRTAPKGCH